MTNLSDSHQYRVENAQYPRRKTDQRENASEASLPPTSNQNSKPLARPLPKTNSFLDFFSFTDMRTVLVVLTVLLAAAGPRPS